MPFSDISTNLIIGFLGVGKTTAIRHLLRQAPEGERWGVLVNEFGEVGIDGALLEDDGAAVREVPGGCLCCVAAGGLQIGLNRLIRDYRPDRILIEPSGLGHPSQILESLLQAPCAQVLAMRATIGLVDARHLSDARYLEHDTFRDQLLLADVLVANKSDLYTEQDRKRFRALSLAMEPAKSLSAMVEGGRLETAWLDLALGGKHGVKTPESHRCPPIPLELAVQEPHCQLKSDSWSKLEGAGGEYRSCGWLIGSGHRFVKRGLEFYLRALEAERIKGIVYCDEGWFAFNFSRDEKRIERVAQRSDSRLEVIHPSRLDWVEMDAALRSLCLAAAQGSG